MWSQLSVIIPIGLLLVFVAIFIVYFKRSFTYWKKRNLPQLESRIPFGTLNPLKLGENAAVAIKQMHQQMKLKKWKHGGIYFFSEPCYMVVDLEYVKNVLTKDFHHFVDRGFGYVESDEVVNTSLPVLRGTEWKNLRTKLTQTFTSRKMKMMFQTLVDCDGNIHKKIKHSCESKQPIDLKKILQSYTTDVIGSCGFGLDCNSFVDDDSPFRMYSKEVFHQTLLKFFKAVLPLLFPWAAELFRVKMFSEDVYDFFIKVATDTVEYREKNNYTRTDFMQLLIDLKNNKLTEEEGGKNLKMKEIISQSFIFFLVGLNTSTIAMTFTLYELAKNQKIQDKVRNEINTVLARHDKKVTYEAIQEMKYLGQVLKEALRKYPTIPFLTRQCVKDYKVPGEDIIIEKGMRTIISTLGIHYDEEFYPNAEKFDPDRFNEENSRSRPQYAHMPFGEGPRMCIGRRFGVMQSKVGLASLLRKYNFTVNSKTKEPLQFLFNTIMLISKGDIWLDAQKI